MHKVKGQTYVFNVGSNVGVYVTGKDSCVLIDAGAGANAGDQIWTALTAEGLKPEGVILTHAHLDNCSGAAQLRKEGAMVYASMTDAQNLGSPNRAVGPIIGGKAQPAPTPPGGLTVTIPVGVDRKLMPNTAFSAKNGKPLQLLDLAGHTKGQLGVVTPDGVCFMADAVASRAQLAREPVFELADPAAYRRSLDLLQRGKTTEFVPTHGPVYDFSIADEIRFNRMQLALVEEAVLTHLRYPYTVEELAALLLATFAMDESVTHLAMVTQTANALVNDLKKTNKVKNIHEEGKSRFFVP